MIAANGKLSIEFALLGLLALLWGSSYLLIKVAIVDIPPITLIAARVSIAAVFLLICMTFRKESLPREPLVWRMLFLQAVFNSTGAWTILAWGQQYVDSGLAGVLNSTSPIFVFLITLLITRHEQVNVRKMIGACLGLTGVIMIVGSDVLLGLGDQVTGQLAALAGAVLYACAAIYGKKFTGLPATVTAAGTMIWASLCLVPASLILEQPWLLRPSFTAITCALVLAIFCTGIALLIYFRLVRTLGSMGVASQAYLRAGISVLLGVIFLGEQISLVVSVGLLATLLGVVAINAPSRTHKVP